MKRSPDLLAMPGFLRISGCNDSAVLDRSGQGARVQSTSVCIFYALIAGIVGHLRQSNSLRVTSDTDRPAYPFQMSSHPGRVPDVFGNQGLTYPPSRSLAGNDSAFARSSVPSPQPVSSIRFPLIPDARSVTLLERGRFWPRDDHFGPQISHLTVKGIAGEGGNNHAI
jgi:hypothetical protein